MLTSIFVCLAQKELALVIFVFIKSKANRYGYFPAMLATETSRHGFSHEWEPES